MKKKTELVQQQSFSLHQNNASLPSQQCQQLQQQHLSTHTLQALYLINQRKALATSPTPSHSNQTTIESIDLQIFTTLREVEHLRAFFKDEAATAQLKQCCSAFNIQVFKKHEKIFQQDEHCETFSIVLQGKVAMYSSSQLYAGQEKYLYTSPPAALHRITHPRKGGGRFSQQISKQLSLYLSNTNNNNSSIQQSSSYIQHSIEATATSTLQSQQQQQTSPLQIYYFLDELTEGQSFGETQILANATRASSCFSIEDSTVLLQLPKQDFLRILKSAEEVKLHPCLYPLIESPAISFLSFNAIKEVFVKSFMVDFKRNTPVCIQNTPPSAAYFVISGEFALWSTTTLNSNKSPMSELPYQVTASKFHNTTSTKMSVIGAGEIFGDIEILSHQTHSHSLKCDSITGTLLVIPKPIFESKVCANKHFKKLIFNRSKLTLAIRESQNEHLQESIGGAFRHFRFDADDTDSDDAAEIANSQPNKLIKPQRKQRQRIRLHSTPNTLITTKQSNTYATITQQPSPQHRSVDISNFLSNTSRFQPIESIAIDTKNSKNNNDSYNTKIQGPNKIVKQLRISTEDSMFGRFSAFIQPTLETACETAEGKAREKLTQSMLLNDESAILLSPLKKPSTALTGIHHHSADQSPLLRNVTGYSNNQQIQSQSSPRAETAHATTLHDLLNDLSSNEIAPSKSNYSVDAFYGRSGSDVGINGIQSAKLRYQKRVIVKPYERVERSLTGQKELNEINIDCLKYLEGFSTTRVSKAVYQDLVKSFGTRYGKNDELKQQKLTLKDQKQIMKELKALDKTGSFRIKIDEKVKRRIVGFEKKMNFIYSGTNSAKDQQQQQQEEQISAPKATIVHSATNAHSRSCQTSPSKEVSALMRNFHYKPNNLKVFKDQPSIAKTIEYQSEQQSPTITAIATTECSQGFMSYDSRAISRDVSMDVSRKISRDASRDAWRSSGKPPSVLKLISIKAGGGNSNNRNRLITTTDKSILASSSFNLNSLQYSLEDIVPSAEERPITSGATLATVEQENQKITLSRESPMNVESRDFCRHVVGFSRKTLHSENSNRSSLSGMNGMRSKQSSIGSAAVETLGARVGQRTARQVGESELVHAQEQLQQYLEKKDDASA